MVIFTFFKFSNNSRNKGLSPTEMENDIEVIVQKHAATNGEKQALRYYLRSLKEALLHPENATQVRNGNRDLDDVVRSLACVVKTWQGTGDGLDTGEIEDQFLSTDGRIKAWITYNQNLSGGMYSLWRESVEGARSK